MTFRKIMQEYRMDENFKKWLLARTDQELVDLGVTELDPFSFSEKYFANRVADVSVAPNANITMRSPNNYFMEEEKSPQALRCFEELYRTGQKLFPAFSLDPFVDGALYFHDKTKYIMPYCMGVTTTNPLFFGLPYGSLQSKHAKHLRSFVAQCLEFFMLHAQQTAGAIAPTDLPATMAYMIKDESDQDIENIYQQLVHPLNHEFRVGGDSPFTNVMVSAFGPYERMFGKEFRFPDGRSIYDLKDGIERVNRIIMDFMCRGDPLKGGMPYRFPIHTVQVTKSDTKTDWFKELSAKNKLGHFNINQTEQFAMCCRFMPDGTDEFVKTGYFGGGGGMQLGSHRVVTLNLPWLAHEARRIRGDIFELLGNYTGQAAMALATHKAILKRYVETESLLFFKIGWMKLDHLYSTVGFHGFPEFLQILGHDPVSQEGVSFGQKVLEFLDKELKARAKEMAPLIGMPLKFNLEEVPAEGSTGTHAKAVNRRFGTRDVFYSNQFVPLYADVPIHKRLAIESEMVSKLSGGSMTFVNLLDRMDSEQSYKLHKRIVENTDISQFSINYGWTVCGGGHASLGFRENCGQCGGPVTHYTRIAGYNTPIEFWNKVRQEELKTRKWYGGNDF
jgi:ribonucleoside-triphosphate reductase